MYHEAGPPVNDGEREVLRRLRDGLRDDWFVLGNFEFPSGARWYECDALAIAPGGWAYLIETKQWVGRIQGNDREWRLPPLAGGSPTSVPSPHPSSSPPKSRPSSSASSAPPPSPRPSSRQQEPQQPTRPARPPHPPHPHRRRRPTPPLRRQHRARTTT